MATGHLWQLFEIDSDFEVRRTHKYRPQPLGKLIEKDSVLFGNPQGEIYDRKIWNDYTMVEVTLGMLKHGLSKPNEAEAKLDDIYWYLKDLQYMEKISEEDKEIYRRRDKIGRYLPKKLRKWFVGVDPEEKNIYNNLY